MSYERAVIGNATLYRGDCMEVLPSIKSVDAVITDPPYSARCHAGHDSADGNDGAQRSSLGYAHLTVEDVELLADAYVRIAASWVVWMTDSDLALAIRTALEKRDLCTFAPLPFYQAGRSVRLSGDGPCSWTDWIVVARTKAARKWRTLPGGYIAGPGWSDKERMGGKPTKLMESLVLDYTRPNDTILDTHMGAGTTGVAAIKCGRKFIGVEVDPASFDTACSRIEQAVAQGQLFQAPAMQQQVQLDVFTPDVGG
jgi:site-specific DNA-methyltransferase (adenine-specific)